VSWAEDAISKVKAANKKFEAALLNGNVGELDKMLTPQFAWIHGTGTFMTREQLLKTSARGPRYASVESDEVKVAVYGDAAVLTERSKRQYPQATAPFLSRFTIVYVKQDEAWRVASMHSSQLQPNGEPLPLDRVMPPGSPSNGASAPAKKN
jgi:ketosteroid isomerase-like protein